MNFHSIQFHFFKFPQQCGSLKAIKIDCTLNVAENENLSIKSRRVGEWESGKGESERERERSFQLPFCRCFCWKRKENEKWELSRVNSNVVKARKQQWKGTSACCSLLAGPGNTMSWKVQFIMLSFCSAHTHTHTPWGKFIKKSFVHEIAVVIVAVGFGKENFFLTHKLKNKSRDIASQTRHINANVWNGKICKLFFAFITQPWWGTRRRQCPTQTPRLAVL
jgi:hypothetical protein